MKVKVSLPNSMLIGSLIMAAVAPSIVSLGALLVLMLHAQATRFARFKKAEQAATQKTASEGQEARLKTVEAEMAKLNSAVNLSKLGR